MDMLYQPIQVSGLDHYTLIVPNAKEVADFHERVLGYTLINTILVNAGSVPQGHYDMLNYVMSWPNQEKGVLVITEGLTKASIFHQFMTKYGQGIHHIAFEVEHIHQAFSDLRARGIKTTSKSLLRDPLSGLKQFFISNEYVGIFIELIERKSETDAKETEQQGFFTQDNMSGLAFTMRSYLDQHTSRDEEISAIDSTQYFEDADHIVVAKIESLTLGTRDIVKAQAFLTQVLGFELRDEHTFFNPDDPNKTICITATHEAGEGTLPAQLQFRIDKSGVPMTKSILQGLSLDFEEEDSIITLSETYAGYPITLKHD